MQTSIVRDGDRAVVRVRGDVVIATAPRLHATLGGLRRRGVRGVVLDLADVDRLDSAGIAVVRLAQRNLKRAGKRFELAHVGDRHRAALELTPKSAAPTRIEEAPGRLEQIGGHILLGFESVRALGHLLVDIARQIARIATRRTRLPRHAVATQVAIMGADAMIVVGLLGLLIGMTIAFQAAVQLRQFGAQAYVGDMVGVSVVRELAPMMTAIMLTGRTGAAIAAELGTMRVGGELDALAAMGISPVRFLVVPRLAALTVVEPALTLIATFIAIGGGMIVAVAAFQMAPVAFWQHVVSRLELGDFTLALVKSVVFAWVIGLSASSIGLRAARDASAVGAATTRAVVVSIFSIVTVDALFATVITLMEKH